MMRPSLLGALLVLSSTCCAGPPPCSLELAALEERQAARIHGLTLDQDRQASLQRLEAALACALPEQEARVLAQARVQARHLELVGAQEEALRLMKVLDASSMPSVRAEGAGLRAALQRVEKRRDALVAYAHDVALQEPVVGPLLLEAWDGQPVTPPPSRAQVLMTNTSPSGTCVVLVLPADLPVGVGLLQVTQGGQNIPLQGDPPALTITAKPPRPLRPKVCFSAPLLGQEKVRLLVDGKVVLEEPLPQDVALAKAHGVAVELARGGVVDHAACHGVTLTSGKLACALEGGR